MRIVHIVEATGGGVLSMLCVLANAQVEKGHEVLVIYSCRLSTPENLREYFSDSVSLYHINMETNLDKFLALRRLNLKVKDYNTDVAFLHSSFAGFLGRLSLFFNKSVRIFYIPHGISFLRKDIGSLRRRIFVFLEKLASFRKSIFLACSQSEKNIILTCLPRVDCRVIENAVSAEAFEFFAQIKPKNLEEIIVVCVARLTPAKRSGWFAQIAREIAVSCSSVRFVWVGDGDEEFKSELVHAGVTVTGWLAPEDVRFWLLRSSAYLSTSHWEGMPIALIEAQLAGVPVIASRCPGNTDVIDHNVTGWLYDSPIVAAKLLKEILIDRDRARLVVNEAKVKASSRFSVERYVSDFEEVLNLQ